MRKGTQEKANNKYRVVVGVKPGEESGNRMVASFKHLGKKFIFSSKSRVIEFLNSCWPLENMISKLADIKEYKLCNSTYINSKAKLILNHKNQKMTA